MHPFSKSTFATLAKFAIPAAIIGFLLWHMDWDKLSDQPKNYWLLSLALVVAMVAISLSFARWVLLVRCQGIELTMLEGFRISSICFLLSFVSAGSVGGDLFKAIFLARRRPGKRIEAVASVLVDRGCGLYGLLLLVAIALLLTNPTGSGESGAGLAQVKAATAVLVALGTIVIAILVLGGRSVDRLVSWGSGLRFVGPIVAKVGPPLRMFHSHWLAFGASIVMSLGVHCLLVVSIFLIATGLFGDPPTIANHFVIVPVALLASALPITPAGIGVFEAAMETMYLMVPPVAARPPEGLGTLVALVFELVKVILAVLGTVFYWTANEEVRESLEAAEEQAADHGDQPIEDEATGAVASAG